MHKTDEYGCILIRQKDKQNANKLLNFATKLAKLLSFEKQEIVKAITELVEEGVLQVDGDKLLQKRMVRDAELSVIRANARKGVTTKGSTNDSTKHSTKPRTNPESEYESDNETKPSKKKAKIPSVEEFIEYGIEKAKENGIDVSKTSISMKYEAWKENGWKNGHQKPIKNWKSTLLNTLPHLKPNSAPVAKKDGTDPKPQRPWHKDQPQT